MQTTIHRHARHARPTALAAAAVLALASCAGDASDEDAAAPADEPSETALLDPAGLAETAPESFRVNFETTKGAFVVEVVRAWSPNGADRFYTLVKHGYYDDVRIFRVVPGFVAQFGLHGDPAVSSAWRNVAIMDDPVVESNVRGTVTFAKTGAPNSRTTQLFINFGDNSRLDADGFAPFGRVVEGMDEVVDHFHSGYGEGVSQPSAQRQGNAYLDQNHPELDRIETAVLVDPAGG